MLGIAFYVQAIYIRCKRLVNVSEDIFCQVTCPNVPFVWSLPPKYHNTLLRIPNSDSSGAVCIINEAFDKK